MEVANIFICFKKNGERSLIYKKTKKTKKDNKEYYYDIENDRILNTDEIDFNTLVSIRNFNISLKDREDIPVYTASRVFKKDNETEINVNNIAYFDIYNTDSNGDYILTNRDVLLRKYGNGKQSFYIDLARNKIIFIPKESVNFIRRINISDCTLEKRKLLEMDYKKEI